MNVSDSMCLKGQCHGRELHNHTHTSIPGIRCLCPFYEMFRNTKFMWLGTLASTIWQQTNKQTTTNILNTCSKNTQAPQWSGVKEEIVFLSNNVQLWEKVHLAKFDNPSPIDHFPGHMWLKERTNFHKLSPDFHICAVANVYVLTCVHSLTQTYIQQINTIFIGITIFVWMTSCKSKPWLILQATCKIEFKTDCSHTCET